MASGRSSSVAAGVSARYSLALVAAAGAVGTLVLVALWGPGWAALLAGVALVCVAGLPMLARLRTDRLDAVGIFAAVTVVTFGLASLAWLGEAPVPGPGLDQRSIALALLVAAAGVAAAAVGSRLTAGSPVASRLASPSATYPSWKVLLCAYAVCVGAILLGLAGGVYGFMSTRGGSTSTSVLSLVASQAAVVILATAMVWLAEGDVRLKRLLVAMLAIQLVLGFVVGVKGESILAFVLVVLAVAAAGRPIPWKWIAAGALVVLMVILPANEAFRSARGAASPGIAGALRGAFEPGTFRPDRTLPIAVEYPFARFRNIDHLALIRRDTPSLYAYGDGASYYLLPLMLVVPRALWDGKPILDGSAQFSRTYWEIPPSIRTAQPLTQIGDLYRNFAVAGVLIGMLLWGSLVGLWQRFRAARPSPRITALYLWSIPVAVAYVESDLPNLIATLARTLPLAALVTWILLPGAAQPPGYQIILRRLGRRSASRDELVEASPG